MVSFQIKLCHGCPKKVTFFRNVHVLLLSVTVHRMEKKFHINFEGFLRQITSSLITKRLQFFRSQKAKKLLFGYFSGIYFLYFSSQSVKPLIKVIQQRFQHFLIGQIFLKLTKMKSKIFFSLFPKIVPWGDPTFLNLSFSDCFMQKNSVLYSHSIISFHQ